VDFFQSDFLSDEEIRAEMEAMMKDLERQRLRAFLTRVASGGKDDGTEAALAAQALAVADHRGAWQRDRDAGIAAAAVETGAVIAARAVEAEPSPSPVVLAEPPSVAL